MPNPNLQPGIVPLRPDARRSRRSSFTRTHNINQYAFYIEDTMKFGHLTINAGLRDDQYNGLTSANGVQPRLGLSYLVPTNTVLRAAYSRTFETPFNENLMLSSGDRRRRPGRECVWICIHSHPARRAESIQYRLPARDRQMADHRCRLFLEVHA